MATITVLDSTGTTQTVAKVTSTGSTTMTNALPVTVATDDSLNTKLDTLHTDITATRNYSFVNLAANATTTIKSGAGVLHTISINSKGITNTATVYDNTAGSGTKIATIDTTLSQATLTYDASFATGLTIVVAGGTAADLTITYR